jgi:hypothetical protein
MFGSLHITGLGSVPTLFHLFLLLVRQYLSFFFVCAMLQSPPRLSCCIKRGHSNNDNDTSIAFFLPLVFLNKGIVDNKAT